MIRFDSEKELRAEQRKRRFLVIRNWLNGIFIVLSIVSIIGVLVFDKNDVKLQISYAIAIVAILVKMVESFFRMPGIFNKL